MQDLVPLNDLIDCIFQSPHFQRSCDANYTESTILISVLSLLE